MVELPPIEYFRCPVPLDEETRALYEEVLERSKERFLRAVQEGQVSFVFACISDVALHVHAESIS